MELGLFIGLLLGLVRVVLPMTGWTIPATAARAVTVVAVVLISVSLALLIWQERAVLSTPFAAVQAILAQPEVRLFLIHASILLLVLIGFVVFLIRPLNGRIQEMHEALVRYVYPRHLSEEQIEKIANYLAQNPSQRINLRQLARNEEASQYRADFQRALTRGGWEVAGIEMAEDLPAGISIDLRTPMATQSDAQAKTVNRVLQAALNEARVKVHSSSGGTAKDITESSVSLQIGRRRMDDADLRSLEKEREWARKILESGYDDM